MSELEKVLAGTLDCEKNDAWSRLFELIDFVLTRERLSRLGADQAKCKELAASVIANQQRLLGNNPIALSENQIAQIYMECL